MANEVCLKAQSVDGAPLSATFSPGKGMNLLSFKKGELEIIDQSTKPLFEERFAGLGAMIGPHFHHRKESVIAIIKNEALFPHIAKVRAKGVKEPFSHGIGRYAPWTIEQLNENCIRAVLTGGQLWQGVLLKELEGQDFKMGYTAQLLPQGLEIDLYVSSETESVVGLHTYYALSNGVGKITSRIQNHYIDKSVIKRLPSTWNFSSDHTLSLTLDQEIDFGFHPFPDPLQSTVLLECPTHQVKVHTLCNNQENSFQLWHPLGASFVCIEPLSAKDPRKPLLSVSQLKILISIL